jgi:Sep-tRNA:Cys-tRNA synthetase
MKYRYKDYIVINPLMRGGIVPEEVKKRLYEEGWVDIGYSACHDCIEGRSSLITKPDIKSFLSEVARFFGGDEAEHTFGCRGAQFAVMKAVSESENKTIVCDPNSHYSTNIAAEMCGLKVAEPPHSGYPEYKIEPGKVEEKIDEIGNPALVVMTHADPYYGNIAPIKEVGKICSEREIPYMVNAAYTGGVKPVNMKELGADFLTISAHKSMASIGPLGFLITNYEWSKKVFSLSKSKAEWTGRVFGKKVPNLFGCSIGGLPLISAMYSFPYVRERVKNWEDEMKKTEYFVEEMENIGDIMLLGDRPHKHHLLHFETPLFWDISKKHKRKGFFLAEEMIKRGIVGLHKGLSKHIKLSVYGLTREEIKKVRDSFEDIAKLAQK